MPLIIGVRFNPAGKVYFFDPTGFEQIRVGEYVVVETARGEEVGKVVVPPRQVSGDDVARRLKGVVRKASAIDLTQMKYYQYRERDALVRCQEKVQEHGLPMKMVRAEYNYDGSRLVFFFAAEKRVDFRKLVQDLARSFRARIELRQIGVRDEAKLIGGIGRCGLALCCSTWLTEFDPVSIKMAKLQDLPLSPMDISGVCGRLLCCLAYESDYYAEVKDKLPRVGKVIDTPHGQGKVVAINVIKETVQVELESQVTVEVTHEELSSMAQAPSKSARRRRRGRRQKD
ncbi:MAG: PSP1 domain-containing protein [Anaerolineae bacterium]